MLNLTNANLDDLAKLKPSPALGNTDNLRETVASLAAETLVLRRLITGEQAAVLEELRKLQQTTSALSAEIDRRNELVLKPAPPYGETPEEQGNWRSRSLLAEAQLAEANATISRLTPELEQLKSDYKRQGDELKDALTKIVRESARVRRQFARGFASRLMKLLDAVAIEDVGVDLIDPDLDAEDDYGPSY